MQADSYFQFDKIVFDARFDSANLKFVLKTNKGVIPNHQFNLYIAEDHPKCYFRTWFYFRVQGLQGTHLFTIKNMNFQVNLIQQSKLIKEGYLPVYRKESQQKFQKIKHAILLNSLIINDNGIQFTFKFHFDSDEWVYFAFNYPWSISQNDEFLRCLQYKCQNKIYFNRSTLILSQQKRKVQLIVLSSFLNMTNYTQSIPKLFPIQTQLKPFLPKPDVKVIKSNYVVHPGQTPSSHIVNGILDFLTSQNIRAQAALNNFVFYIVPLINPDGVYKGTYRSDVTGQNLNRMYAISNEQMFPEIFGIKTFVLSNAKQIQIAVDLHAHAVKKGCFIYGNNTNNFFKQFEICLFPKLMSINCAQFEYDSCNFSQRNMYAKDPGEQFSKQGSARVYFYKTTGIHKCYTLQVNYNSGNYKNIISNEYRVQNKFNEFVFNRQLILQNNMQKRQRTFEKFELSDFFQIGVGLVCSVLDFFGVNPESKIPSSYMKHIKNVKLNVAFSLIRSNFRFNNKLRIILESINRQQNVQQNLRNLYLFIEKKISEDQFHKFFYVKKTKSLPPIGKLIKIKNNK